MKRLLSITAALLVAALFALPTAAIANLDGTEPAFEGEAGIVPLSDTIEVIGDPDATAPDETPADGSIDRSALARSEDTPIQAYAALALAACAGLGTMSLAALTLSIIVLAKVNKLKAAADSTEA